MAATASARGHAFARAVAIGMQVSTLMKRLTKYGDRFAEDCAECARNKMFNRLTFCAMDRDGDCVAKAIMEIDWDKNQFLVSKGADNVTISGDGTLPETTDLIKGMLTYIEGMGCRMDVYFHPTQGNYD